MNVLHDLDVRERRLAWFLLTPVCLVLSVVAIGPLAFTMWESLHLHDLRMPWRGEPFVGLAHYRQAVADSRFLEALQHTGIFTVVSVALELTCGVAIALALDSIERGRAIARTVILLPWALPTVVAALMWRFAFDGPGLGTMFGFPDVAWFADSTTAWVPIIVADVWRSTPFVALLVLAALQSIDRELHEAARLDGASALQRFREVTLPLLWPTIAIVVVFRTLDALRVFDLVYVLTAGGPGTATEVVSLYAFSTLLQNLRFGYGSALTILVFGFTLLVAVVLTRTRHVGRRGMS